MSPNIKDTTTPALKVDHPSAECVEDFASMVKPWLGQTRFHVPESYTPSQLVLTDLGWHRELPNCVYTRPLVECHAEFQHGPRWGLFFYSQRTPSHAQREVRNFFRIGGTGFLEHYIRDELEALRDRRHGVVAVSESDQTITITPSNCGVRRTDLKTQESVVSATVARASDIAFLSQYVGSPGWQYFFFQPNLYSAAIHPHLSDQAFGSPLAWTAACMEIVHGHGVSCLNHDYRALASEHAFMLVAAEMGNLRNEERDRERVYNYDSWCKEAYRLIRSSASETIVSDVLLFALDNRDRLTHEQLSSQDFGQFVATVERALTNGLNPYHASSLFQLFHSEAPDSALARTTKTISDIFCQGEVPWWFHRDFPIVNSGLRGAEVQMIASVAGFAFEETAPLYLAKGRELASFAEVGSERAIRFCSYVINNYGAGNSTRARAIVQYAIDFMREYGERGSTAGLTLLEDCLERSKPSSKIVAILEGPKASFSRFGLRNLRAVFGLASPQEEQSLELTSGVEAIRQLGCKLALPLESRAFNPIPLDHSVRERTAGLLGTHIPLGPRQLLLECAPPIQVPSPVVAWHEFDARLSSEVQRDREARSKIADIYFGLFSAKMPHPLNPPPGFLAFLQQYDEIRDPRIIHTWPGMSEAARHTQNNRDLYVQKFLAVSAVLDAQLIGLVSQRAVDRLFNWITAPLSAGDVKAIEVVESYNAIRTSESRVAHLADKLLTFHHSLARDYRHIEVEKLPGDRHLLLEPDFEREARDALLLKELRYGLSDVEQAHRRKYQDYEVEPRSFEEHFEAADQIDPQQLIEAVRRSTRERLQLQQQGRRERFCAIAPMIYNLNLLVAARVLQAHEHRYCLDPLIERLISESPEGLETSITPIQDQEEGDRGILTPNAATVSEHLSADLLEWSDWLDQARVSEKLRGSLGSWKDLAEVTRAVRESIREGIELRDKVDAGDLTAICEANPVGSESLLRTPSNGRMLDEASPWLRALVLAQCDKGALSSARTRLPHSGGASLHVANQGLLGSFVAQTMINKVRQACPENPTLNQLGTLFQQSLANAISDESLNYFREVVREFRLSAAALSPIGCKLHLHSEMDQKKLDALSRLIPFQCNGFKLDNAARCLTLPAMPSARELIEVARLLAEFGIIKPHFPEYQFCMQGRLPPEQCAILGATMILSAIDNPEYTPEMFATNRDNQTGKRMVIYDAGGELAVFAGGAAGGASQGHGRTDVIGIIDISRAPTFQLVGSILSHGIYGGPLADLSRPFQADLRELLRKHGLEDVLAASWVHGSHTQTEDASEHFFQGILPCLNAWKRGVPTLESDQQSGEPNIIAEMRDLVDRYNEKATLVRGTLLGDPAFVEARRDLFFLRDETVDRSLS